MGSDMFGVAGDDITLKVPVGTIISDAETGEVLYELLTEGEVITIAKGGDGGFGNMRFKSAINRALRQKTSGWPGEKKSLKLELKVLADVGLLGMPNAGKLTLISAILNARPRIADYPFTTLHPNLGVVRVGPEQSFPDQHAGRVAERFVGGCATTSQCRLVDNVVVQQCGGVDELHHSGQVEALFARVSQCARHQQQERGPQALAARGDDVLGDLADQRHACVEAACDHAVDFDHVAGNQVQHGGGGGGVGGGDWQSGGAGRC